MDGQCTSWLAQYTMGVNDNICAFNGTGLRFGQKTYSHFLLQIHYNNELSESGIIGTQHLGTHGYAGHTRKASRISKTVVENCGKGVGNF